MNKLALVSWTLGIGPVADLMDKVLQHGLDRLWFAGDHTEYDAAEVRRVGSAKGVQIVCVDPMHCKPPVPREASAAGAIAYYRGVVQFAADLGGCPVAVQGMSQWTVNCKDRSDAGARLIAVLRAVDAFAKENEVPLYYEAVNPYEAPLIHSSTELNALLDALGSANVHVTLDAFHMHGNEQSSTRAILSCAKRLKAYHISDSGRGGIGSGQTDFIAEFNTLAATGFDGIVAVELVLPELTPSQPPRTPDQRARLDIEIARSVAVWTALGTTAMPAPCAPASLGATART